MSAWYSDWNPEIMPTPPYCHAEIIRGLSEKRCDQKRASPLGQVASGKEDIYLIPKSE
jgi:hypothetical protein